VAKAIPLIPGLSFGDPLALTLLIVVPGFSLLIRFKKLQHRLADDAYGGSPSLRLGWQASQERFRDWSVVLAAMLIVIAIARPQWGSVEQSTAQHGVDIAIALDVSSSMTADDLAPSRSAIAAAGINDFLTHLRSDRVGLVIFAGQAFQRSPLTLDLSAIRQLVNQAQRDSELIAIGTDLGTAIDESLKLLNVPDAADKQLIIVVSDGEDLAEKSLSAAKRATEVNIPIYTIAVGTADGAMIPGAVMGTSVSRADRDALRAIAVATGGEFRELETIAGLAIDVQRMRQSIIGKDTGKQPIEQFQWFVIAALVLLVIPMFHKGSSGLSRLARQGLTTGTILSALIIGACSDSQLYEYVETGNQAYADKRYNEALTAYRLALLEAPDNSAVMYNLGNTLHQLRRYEEASVTSTEALRLAKTEELSESIRYALGNHAVMRGALEEARRQYVDVLRRSPDDINTKANLELVLSQTAAQYPSSQQSRSIDESDSAEVGESNLDSQRQSSTENTAKHHTDEWGSKASPIPAEKTLDRIEAREALLLAIAEMELRPSNEPSAETVSQLLALIRELNKVEPLSGIPRDSKRASDR